MRVKRFRICFGSRARGLEVGRGERSSGGLFEEFGMQCHFVRLERPEGGEWRSGIYGLNLRCLRACQEGSGH